MFDFMKKANFVLLKFGSPDPHFLTCDALGGLTWRFNQGLLVAVDGRVGALCCDLSFGHAEVGSNGKDHFVLHVGDQRGQISVRKKKVKKSSTWLKNMLLVSYLKMLIIGDES
jgi:hypothetical protein